MSKIGIYNEAGEPLGFEYVYDEPSDPDVDLFWDSLPGEDDERCPACGEWGSYCQGHGEIGDPVGRQILQQHDDGDHSSCNPLGCEEANHG